MKVAIDRELCMGSGMCIVYAPGSFAHDDLAKAVVLEPLGDDPEAVRTAASACPMAAITIDEGA